jgi:RNA polymerase sigma-70 factor, ECF subfamily
MSGPHDPTAGSSGELARRGATTGDGARAQPVPPTDVDLMQRSAAGDRDAFLALYDRYSGRVYGLVASLLGRGPQADDAFQDALWDVWRRASSYNPNLGPVDSWILMIARSRAIDVLRRGRREAALKAALRHEAHTSEGGAAPASPLVQDQAHACDRVLSGLPAEQASAIRLAYVRGMSREEIASALNIPVGTVKSRIRSGIRAVAEAIAHSTRSTEAVP